MGPLYRNQKVIMVGGQGVEFHYSYDRYIHEVKEGSSAESVGDFWFG